MSPNLDGTLCTGTKFSTPFHLYSTDSGVNVDSSFKPDEFEKFILEKP